MKKTSNNYAFIDSQNLHLGVQKLGWKLSYKKFRVYLKEKYNVQKAYLFIGFISKNLTLYSSLQNAGFVLKFKPTIPDKYGVIKGNVDADMVLQTMINFHEFDKAVIVSSDGDFYSLVRYLSRRNKLEMVLSADPRECSSLLKIAAADKIRYMTDLKEKLEYK